MHQNYQQRPPSSWNQQTGRGGFRGGARGGFRGNTRGFGRGRGRGRGGGGGHRPILTDAHQFDKTAPLDYSAETLQQYYGPYYSPLFSQDPWTTSP